MNHKMKIYEKHSNIYFMFLWILLFLHRENFLKMLLDVLEYLNWR